MKVYATLIEDGEVVLKTWSSKAKFQSTEGWCNPKFISVACTEDLAGYEFSNERSMIVRSEDKLASELLLREAFFALKRK